MVYTHSFFVFFNISIFPCTPINREHQMDAQSTCRQFYGRFEMFDIIIRQYTAFYTTACCICIYCRVGCVCCWLLLLLHSSHPKCDNVCTCTFRIVFLIITHYMEFRLSPSSAHCIAHCWLVQFAMREHEVNGGGLIRPKSMCVFVILCARNPPPMRWACGGHSWLIDCVIVFDGLSRNIRQ